MKTLYFVLKKLISILVIITFSLTCFAQRGEWKKVQKINTLDAYQEFINNYPNSKFIDDAKKELPPVTSESLFEASKGGNYEYVRYILDKNPELVNVIDKDGYTPLLFACLLGQTKWSFAMDYSSVVELLLEKGADVNVRSKEFGYSALHIIIVGLVLNEKTIKSNNVQVNINGKSLLEILYDTQNRSLHYVLRMNSNVDAKDNTGSTPLYWAAYYGLKNIAKQLIDAGANPSIKNNDGKSSYDIALEKGHKDFF